MFPVQRLIATPPALATRLFLGTVTLAGLTLGAGCAADRVGQVGENPREILTYAATAKYPGNARPSDDVRAVALNYSDRERIEIHNLRDAPIEASAVWVNGAFVRPLNRGSIPPRGYVTVRYENLVEAGPGTNDLKTLDRSVQRVELQTPNGLVTVDGPIGT